MQRHDATFAAHDEDGHLHTLHVYIDILDASTFGNPNTEVEGLRSISTDSGDPVNRLDKGRYQVVTTGQILTSADSAAP